MQLVRRIFFLEFLSASVIHHSQIKDFSFITNQQKVKLHIVSVIKKGSKSQSRERQKDLLQ